MDHREVAAYASPYNEAVINHFPPGEAAARCGFCQTGETLGAVTVYCSLETH